MSRARVTALRLLTRRDYTTSELRTKLLDREFPEPEVETAIADLAHEGFVNDRRVAESFVRVSSNLKGRGRHRIERELEQRGVDRSIIREVLAGLPVADETASIRRFLERKRLPARLSPAEHRRTFGQLMRRGFSADLIASALRSRGSDLDA
ncbi:MAG: regulatory protein RecX [Acidobacteria bacterium]|jgi:regulatory protein|nr:regulatory protein RecX [Acidobacteriota bacterium]